jgi:hypothetical protein
MYAVDLQDACDLFSEMERSIVVALVAGLSIGEF